jgi:hypothetical protein
MPWPVLKNADWPGTLYAFWCLMPWLWALGGWDEGWPFRGKRGAFWDSTDTITIRGLRGRGYAA